MTTALIQTRRQSKYSEEEKLLLHKYNEFREKKKAKEKSKTINSIEAAKKILAEERCKEETSKKNSGFKRSHLRMSRDTSKAEERQTDQKRQKTEESFIPPKSRISKLDSVLESMKASGIVNQNANVTNNNTTTNINVANLSVKELEQRSVCVTNLSDKVDENLLRGKFSRFGNIIKLETFFDQGYALIYYATEESAHAAESLNNKSFGGNIIAVYKPSLSEPVEQKPTFAEPPSTPSFAPSYSSSVSTESSTGKNFGRVFSQDDTPSSFEDLNSGGRKLTTYDDL